MGNVFTTENIVIALGVLAAAWSICKWRDHRASRDSATTSGIRSVVGRSSVPPPSSSKPPKAGEGREMTADMFVAFLRRDRPRSMRVVTGAEPGREGAKLSFLSPAEGREVFVWYKTAQQRDRTRKGELELDHLTKAVTVTKRKKATDPIRGSVEFPADILAEYDAEVERRHTRTSIPA